MRAPLIPSPLERVLPIVSPAPRRSVRPLTRPFDRLRATLSPSTGSGQASRGEGKTRAPLPLGEGLG